MAGPPLQNNRRTRRNAAQEWVRQVMQDGIPTPRPTLGQSTLLWGALSLCVTIVFTVVAAMTKDVRWGLYGALPFASIALWEFLGYFVQSKTRRALITATASLVILAGLIWLYIALRESSIMAAQEDTKLHLTAQMHLPPTGNPFDSIFTITNGSSNEIPQHTLDCQLNLVVFQGPLILDQGRNHIKSRLPLAPLSGYGDSDSVACLAAISHDRPLACADLGFDYEYSISQQLDVKNSQPFRFVYSPQFGWQSVPNKESGSRCESADTAMPDTSGYKIVTACPTGCDYERLQPAMNAATCGTVIYYDKQEKFDPQHPFTIPNTPCTANRQVVVIASANPLADKQHHKQH